jgi:hypothetical protein
MDNSRQSSSGGVVSEYQAPRLVVHGSVVDLTLAHAAGGVTDHSFPAGTPVSQLTFSG